MTNTEPVDKTPIAIVGMSCRFPGAKTVSEFYNLLKEGREINGEVPEDRFDADFFLKRGDIYTKAGKFLENIDQFDADVFGMTTHAAERTDPQTRLLLETTWEALEDAGIPFESLDDEVAGTFIGMMYSEFQSAYRRSGSALDIYSAAGSLRSSAPSYLPHRFNLSGPALSVDSACSSSLLAAHLATNSLRMGECDLALAGGANIIMVPDNYIVYCSAEMLSRDGHVKFGDVRADGFARGEGAGVVVLKRLEDAVADNDRIYAVIRDIYSNNDARRGESIFLNPSEQGQAACLRRVYEQTGIDRRKVRFIQCHGTGTPAGDPSEISALSEVFEQEDRQEPLMLGSVKTNIGHTEGAAGIAGLITTALSLHHSELPPSVNFEDPNPRIPWERVPVEIPTESVSLSDEEELYGGVSVFGLGGTNTHAVLQRWNGDVDVTALERDQRPQILPLSAHSLEALEDHMSTFEGWLPEGEDAPEQPSLPSICSTAARRRTHRRHRVAGAGESTSQVLDDLRTNYRDVYEQGEPGRDDPKIAFVYSGHGGQWAEMGRELMEAEPHFRESFVEIANALSEWVDWSPIELIEDESRDEWPENTRFVQPMLFVLQAALTRLLESYGVEPEGVIGHSMGEIVAAWTAGSLDLSEATRLIARRGELTAEVRDKGGMLAVGLPAEEVESLLETMEGLQDRVTIAIVNSPSMTVLSGGLDALEEAKHVFETYSVFCSRVDIDFPAHCPETEPVADQLAEEFQGLSPNASKLAQYSATRARKLDDEEVGAEYWWENMRAPIRFADAIEKMAGDAFNIFIEVGPHPVLIQPIRETLNGAEANALVFGSSTRDEEVVGFTRSLSKAYTAGIDLDWSRRYSHRQPVSFPTYPFQRERYWFEDRDLIRRPVEGATASGQPSASASLPFGLQVRQMKFGESRWKMATGSIALQRHALLSDHRVTGRPVFPATGYIELGAALGQKRFETDQILLEGIGLHEQFELSETEDRDVRVDLEDTGSSGGRIRISGGDRSDPDQLFATFGVRPNKPGDVAPVYVATPGASKPVEDERFGLDEVWLHNVRAAAAKSSGATDRLPVLVRMDNIRWKRDRSESADELAEFGNRLGPMLRGGSLLVIPDSDRMVVLVRGVGEDEDLDTVANRISKSTRAHAVENKAIQVDEALELWARKVPPEVESLGDLLDDNSNWSECADPFVSTAPNETSSTVRHERFYELTREMGIDYGSTFRLVDHVTVQGQAGRAELTIEEETAQDRRFRFHPAIVDAALHASFAVMLNQKKATTDTLGLPVEIDSVSLFRKPTETVSVHIWYRGSEAQNEGSGRFFDFDVLAVDEQGRALFEVNGARTQQRSRGLLRYRLSNWMVQLTWKRFEGENWPEPDSQRPWIVVGDLDAPPFSVVTETLEDIRQVEERISGGRKEEEVDAEVETERFERAIDEQLASIGSRQVGVLYCVGEGGSADSPPRKLVDYASETATLARSCLKESEKNVSIRLITSSGQQVGGSGIDDERSTASYALWSVWRTLVSEEPTADIRMIDIDSNVTPTELNPLLETPRDDIDEPAVALRGGESYRQRFQRPEWDGEVSAPNSLPPEQTPGQFQSGSFEFIRDGSARPLELTTVASVDEEGTIPAGVGFTARSGEDSSRYFGLTPTSLDRPEIVLPSELAVEAPSGCEDKALAGAIRPYLIARLALVEFGRLAEGERLLIHCADHPVGWAAIQLAKELGAEVHVSPKSPDAGLRLEEAFGVEVIAPEILRGFSSIQQLFSELRFELVFSVQTSANQSWALENMPVSESDTTVVTAEMGDDPNIGMPELVELGSGVSQSLVQIASERPRMWQRALIALQSGFAAGNLTTPVSQPFADHRLEERELESTGFATKVDTAGETQSNQSVRTGSDEGNSRRSPFVREAATYLIPGGTGGLGMLLAERLAEKGAGRIGLLGRSEPDETTKERVDAMVKRGTKIEVMQCDVTDEKRVEEVVKQLHSPDADLPLRGIFHLAGIPSGSKEVSENGYEDFDHVVGPKAFGAWHLVDATQHIELDYFVMFSSMASLLGLPYVSPYAAGNAFLDAVALSERDSKKNFLTINWGAWGEIGLAADTEAEDVIEQQGFEIMDPNEVVRAVELLVEYWDEPLVGVGPMNWPKVRRLASFTKLVGEELVESESETSVDGVEARIEELVEILKAPESEGREAAAVEYLQHLVGRRLDQNGTDFDPNESPSRYGLDSMLAVDVRTQLEQTLGLDVDVDKILTSTFRELGSTILRLFEEGDAEKEVDPFEDATLDDDLRIDDES